MTPYNRILQLHADGLNNSEIERAVTMYIDDYDRKMQKLKADE